MIELCSVALAAAALLISLCTVAAGEELSNRSFTPLYDGTGIQSLKRTGDTYDADYIAANACSGAC